MRSNLRQPFHLEEVPSNAGQVNSEVIFGDSDRRRWPNCVPIWVTHLGYTICRKLAKWWGSFYDCSFKNVLFGIYQILAELREKGFNLKSVCSHGYRVWHQVTPCPYYVFSSLFTLSCKAYQYRTYISIQYASQYNNTIYTHLTVAYIK
jgi:hypothetical protein